MRIRKVLLLPLVWAVVLGCGDETKAPRLETRSTPLRDETWASRPLWSRSRASHVIDAAPSPESLKALAADMVEALDIPAKMVVSAQLTSPHADAAAVQKTMGDIKPRKGGSMVVLSTGLLKGGSAAEPGTDFSPVGPAGDSVKLKLTLQVPADINQLSFHYNFLSTESPEYVGSDYNDRFLVRVTDSSGVREVQTASVNSSTFFDVSSTHAGGSGFDLFSDDPTDIDLFPLDIEEGRPVYPDAGLTDFQMVSVPVVGGGQVTVEFEIRDEYDGFLDSAVLLDRLSFAHLELIDPNPSLVVGGVVTHEYEKLAKGGVPIINAVADGVTQLLLRIKVPDEKGMVQFTLDADASSANGQLKSFEKEDWSNKAEARIQDVDGEYYAFALYQVPADFNTEPHGPLAAAKERLLNITVQYLPTDRAGFVGRLEVPLVRPPVVIIPTMWTECDLWKSLPSVIGLDPRFFVECATGYLDSNADSLSSVQNEAVVADYVNTALVKMRKTGTAVSQVDIIGHGSGGLLVRKYAESSEYTEKGSYGAGTLNRFIAVNTPHLGSRLAREVFVMRDALLAKGPLGRKQYDNVVATLERAGVTIDDKSVLASLQPESDFIQTLGKTVVPTHVVMSYGGQGRIAGLGERPLKPRSYDILYASTKVLFTQMEFYHPLVEEVGKRPLDNLILGPDSLIFHDTETDIFLTEEEQLGGLPRNATAVSRFEVNFDEISSEHFKIANDAEHHEKFIELLNREVGGEYFVPALPSPSSVLPPPAPKRVSSHGESAERVAVVSQKGLTLVLPDADASVRPGSYVNLRVSAEGGYQPAVAVIMGAGQLVFPEPLSTVMPVFVPAESLGSVEFVAYGIDAEGESFISAPIVLPVKSAARMTSVVVADGDVLLRAPGGTRQLRVRGGFDDGVLRDLTSSQRGTVYASSNSNVVEVSDQGLLTGVKEGIATVTVRNQKFITSITVNVRSESAKSCIQVRLGDYNLFVLEDFVHGHYVQGKVAAGRDIRLEDFAVGEKLSDTNISNALVAGRDISLSHGGVWGDVRYGQSLATDSSVSFERGTSAQGTPLDFTARGLILNGLSRRLATLPSNGSVTLTPWNVILLHGSSPKLNVFTLQGRDIPGNTLLQLDAPANSLAVINVEGREVTFSSLGQNLVGGINARGVLFNFPQASTLNAANYSFEGTVLAPGAHVSYAHGVWRGGIYARSLTGDNASGELYPLRDVDICE